MFPTQPDSRKLIDVHRPLYSSDGFEHSFVTASAHQVVTRYSGVFGLWDRRTGQCLNAGHEDLRLSNVAPNPAVLASQRAAAQETLARLHAEAAIEAAMDYTGDEGPSSPRM